MLPHEYSQLDADQREAFKRADVKFRKYFPDCTPGCRKDSENPKDHTGFCRVLYPRHIAFMDAGARHIERLFLKANRVGGTECAAYELTAHLTGRYPHWWTGRRFDRPIRAWAAGDTMLTTRDVLQHAMLGPIDVMDSKQWSGMIPYYTVEHITPKVGGVPKCVDQIWVKHITGGRSVIEFRSYDQGRRTFQGTELDVCWEDEEPPEDVYAECLLRVMTSDQGRGGIVLATFTPLQGLTPFIKSYLETSVVVMPTGEEVSANRILNPEVV